VSAFRVGFAPEALDLVEEIRAWWLVNRRANPRLFDDELRAAWRRVGGAPHAGQPYAHPRVPGVRRVLMPRSRYHVYYVTDEAAGHVWILAIWHVARGGQPPL
jgi:plasmid stabilization system protein ParE